MYCLMHACYMGLFGNSILLELPDQLEPRGSKYGTVIIKLHCGQSSVLIYGARTR